MLNSDIKTMWLLYSLPLQYSTAPSLLEREKEGEARWPGSELDAQECDATKLIVVQKLVTK
jgi:hypothetical protein